MGNKEIYNMIISDLSEYGQHDQAPKSLTLGDKKIFRHYELGSCFGLVAFNPGHIMICEIKEDDDNWFCFNNTDKISYDSSWIKTKIELYSRMQNWLDENLTRGYYSGFEGKKGMECGYKHLKKK